MKTLKNFQESYNDLIDLFIETYYKGAYVELWYLHEDDTNRLYPIMIADDHWGIDDIYMSLMLWIPEDVLHQWYSDFLDHAMENKQFINLYTYYKNYERNNKN